MRNEAHGMRLEHPIFTTPRKVTVELEKKETPDGYFKYPGGDALGKTIEVWKVHEGVFPKVDVGLVSVPYGFEDSPDAEVISSGINSKGPRAVALGRHGNFFLWGFFGDASMLTPSARDVFVNTIHYMKQFDGQTPLVRVKTQSREVALGIPAYMRGFGESYSRRAQSRFSDEIREKTGMDPDKLQKYLEENLEYLHHAENRFEIDADVRDFGVSNRRLELLDKLVERLKESPRDEISWRLIERYVNPEGFDSAEAFIAWVQKNREFLFFSDVGGYRWFIDEHARKRSEKLSAVK